MAVSPKMMRLLCTSKSASPRFTSGGSTSMPSLRASEMWSMNTSRLFPSSISDDSSAAMYSAV